MPCFKPLEAAWQGKGDRPIIYKRGERPDPLPAGYEPINLPCRQCIGCKLERSRVWGARCMHEACMHLANCWITLTYDDDWLPYGRTLVPEHLQKFFKRLRRRIEPQQIKYYACGEYGSQCEDHRIENCPMCGPLQRPHYHAVI